VDADVGVGTVLVTEMWEWMQMKDGLPVVLVVDACWTDALSGGLVLACGGGMIRPVGEG